MRALLATFAVVVFSSAQALACDDHMGKCTLDAVKVDHNIGLVNLHGSTTCDRGRLVARVYDGTTFLGVVSGTIRGHAIRTTHVDAPESFQVENLRIKYSIEPR